MLISHSRKFIFIHNFKVAGTSVYKTLEEFTNITFRRSPRRDQLKILTGIYPWIFSSQFDGHILAKDLRKQLPGKIFQEYYKFGFVRNPWDWQVSQYCFMLKEGPKHHQYDIVSKLKSFDEYIDWRVHHDIHFQYEFFYDEDENNLMDFIGRFENLKTDFNHICNIIGVQKELLHENRSRDDNNYLKYYSPNSIKMVEEAFQKDIRIFGYETPAL